MSNKKCLNEQGAATSTDELLKKLEAAGFTYKYDDQAKEPHIITETATGETWTRDKFTTGLIENLIDKAAEGKQSADPIISTNGATTPEARITLAKPADGAPGPKSLSNLFRF